VVVARGHKHPIRRAHLVAAVTRQGRRHVSSRFPAGLNPVMAGHAGAGCDPLMFEGRSRPTNRPMAAITGHGRRNMSSRLTYRNSLVMAFGAGSRSDTVMGKERRRPICRPVAAVTVDRGRQMVCRLKCGDDSSSWRMALHALRRRSSKYALQVASFTHDLRVATAERKAGAAVINFNVRAVTSLGRSGIRHQQHRAAYRQKPGNNCPGKESTSCPVSQLSHSCIRHCATSVACAHDDR
jgi:hypothetical protein